jgi:hypothetical protein
MNKGIEELLPPWKFQSISWVNLPLGLRIEINDPKDPDYWISIKAGFWYLSSGIRA